MPRQFFATLYESRTRQSGWENTYRKAWFEVSSERRFRQLAGNVRHTWEVRTSSLR
jgi:hypothetical protein